MSLCGVMMVWAAGPAEPPFISGDFLGLSGVVAVSASDQIFGFWAGAALFSEGGELVDAGFIWSPFGCGALISNEW